MVDIFPETCYPINALYQLQKGNKMQYDSHKVNVFINCYGAPAWVASDPNYYNYLNFVKDHIAERPEIFENGFQLYMAGGYTENTEVSEAQVMCEWFEHHGFPKYMSGYHLLEESATGRANVEAMECEISQDELSTTFFFCEHTRRFSTKFFVKNIFATNKREFEVVGVPFDERSLRWYEYAKTIFLRFPLLILSYYSTWTDTRIVKPLRARHVEKCRKEYKKNEYNEKNDLDV